MKLFFLDSACLADVTAALPLGFVRGVTTNPALLRRETADPMAHLKALLAEAGDLDVYYQPTGAYDDGMAAEGYAAAQLNPDRVVIKLPVTPTGIQLAASLVAKSVRVALTAAQSPTAMPVAESLACYAVIPYVDRAVRDLATDSDLVARLAAVRTGPVKIVAASIKSTEQTLRAFEDGADVVSAPVDVLLAMVSHPASVAAESEFNSMYQPRSQR